MRRSLVLLTLGCALGCEPGAGADFGGTFEGAAVRPTHSVARHLSRGAVSISLDTFPDGCSQPPPPGSYSVAFILENPRTGTFTLDQTVVGGSTSASLAHTIAEADGGTTLDTFLFTDGTITVSSISDGGIKGSASVRSARANLTGGFDATWCP